MMLNRYGVPIEHNDRLLELMYPNDYRGCRHEYGGPYPMGFMGVMNYKCAKCEQYTHFAPEPAVGDGRAVTLGEMVSFARKWFPSGSVSLFWDDATSSIMARVVWIDECLHVREQLADTPEAGAAAAIIAAMDGAKE